MYELEDRRLSMMQVADPPEHQPNKKLDDNASSSSSISPAELSSDSDSDGDSDSDLSVSSDSSSECQLDFDQDILPNVPLPHRKKMPSLHTPHHHKVKRIKRELLAKAADIGSKRTTPTPKVLIVYNPKSGGGKAARYVRKVVKPIFDAAGVCYRAMPTKYRGHAQDLIQQCDGKCVNSIAIVGGDGMVHETITGVFRRPDKEEFCKRVAFGIIPCGTANAMANELHTEDDTAHISLAGYAALAIAQEQVRTVDVLQMIPDNDESQSVCGLSCIGWGFAGVVAKQADELRWLPGQKKSRYDIAGAVSMIKGWPSRCKAFVSYPVSEQDPASGQQLESWHSEEMNISNLLATNMPTLGLDNHISKDISIDDGHVALVILEDLTRMRLVKHALAMKRGHALADQQGVTSFRVKEFKITPSPQSLDCDLNIDGDPHPVARSVHIKVRSDMLRLYAAPVPEAQL